MKPSVYIRWHETNHNLLRKCLSVATHEHTRAKLRQLFANKDAYATCRLCTEVAQHVTIVYH